MEISKRQVLEESREEEKLLKRKKRIEEMKKKKKRQELWRKYSIVIMAGTVLVAISITSSVVRALKSKCETEIEVKQSSYVENSKEIDEQEQIIENVCEYEELETAMEIMDKFIPLETEKTEEFSKDIISEYGILIDIDNERILAKKNAYEKMYPASMTKILTVLVAAEKIDDLNDTFVMTREITDYSYRNDCSSVGFEVGEEIPLIDLFYGTILQSGADAALGLAYYVAGSQEAFVEMMNTKVQELGISETTHFTNCVGIYNQNHYSTAYDMAIILKNASDNELCKKIMSTHTYTTTKTKEHEEGITISNWFLRRIEDRDTHGLVLCGKTGYVTQSGNCAASLSVDKNGNEYICVTSKSSSVWKCIGDQTSLYAKYLVE